VRFPLHRQDSGSADEYGVTGPNAGVGSFFSTQLKEEIMCVSTFIRCRPSPVAVAMVMFCVAVGARAQSDTQGPGDARGRIDFEAADLPAPSVEVDLNRGMFRDLFGIGDAAVAGVAESLLQSSDRTGGAETTRLAAEQLAAARQILQLASDVVREVRIRVYRDVSDESLKPETLAAQFDNQLRAGKWDNVVRVRDNEESVRVSLLREEGAIHGIFIIAGHQGKELVLANVVCDLSPDNIKKVTAAATKIGLENGLAQVIEAKMPKHRLPPQAPPEPPQPNGP
jgi:hypothetical protein